MDTAYQYFELALDWLTKYDMFKLLAQSGIIPGDKYDPRSIRAAVKSELGTEPTIRCVQEKGTREMSLKEIYICFNTELQLIDCRKDSNCNANVINYPNTQIDTSVTIVIIYAVALIIIFIIILIYKLYKYRQDRSSAQSDE